MAKSKFIRIIVPGAKVNLEDWEPESDTPDDGRIISPDKSARELPTLGQPSVTEDEIADLFMSESLEGGILGRKLLDRLGNVVKEVNALVAAQNDAQRFKALVDEAERLGGPAHKERILRMAGCRLVLAKIWYMNPDHPTLINGNYYVRQELDSAPNFPLLIAFCAWWNKTLDGQIHHVVTNASKVFSIDELRAAAAQYELS
jgi:uncharacterized protein Usg